MADWDTMVDQATRMNQDVAALDEQLAALTDGMDLRDVDQLAQVWWLLDQTRRQLSDLCGHLRRDIGETGVRAVHAGDQDWSVRPRWREEWDTTALLAAVVARADEDGLDPVGAVRDVWALGRPRTTVLKNSLRLLPEEFCEKSQQGWDLAAKPGGRP